jgi:hypothetical protein
MGVVRVSGVDDRPGKLQNTGDTAGVVASLTESELLWTE